MLGESGSGKTVLSRALTRLFPLSSLISVQGSVVFEGRSLHEMDERELTPIRRSMIRYVFQDPMDSLNPLATIRKQLRLAHDGAAHDDRALSEALDLVGLTNGAEVLELYPHQLSVGMAQRVCIAMALLPSPALLIADEPTSAVDASLRYRLLDLLAAIQRKRGMAMILITHDLDVARCYGDRVLVIYRGRIIESGPRRDFFATPLHPYSRLLIEAIPQEGASTAAPQGQTQPIAGNVPPFAGCRFQLNCRIAQAKCAASEPELDLLPSGREVRCFFSE